MTSDIKDGTLYFDGCDTTELAKKYGTPLYVISAKMIKDKFAQLQEEFISKYPKARVAYACKAFCTKEMLRLCAQEGVSIDVVSGGELYTAMAVDFPPERIEFNGNNKLRSELEMAIDYGIGRIIVDGIGELAPTRRKDLAKLGIKALIAGTLASYISAAMAGILL